MVKVTGQPSLRFHSDGVLAIDDPPISPLPHHSDANMASVSHSILLLFERTVTLTMPCSLLAGHALAFTRSDEEPGGCDSVG
jgi:hypothetical protein